MNTRTTPHDARAELEVLLSPYEQRPVTADPQTMLAHRSGGALAHDLNRLQGADYTEVDARLDRLWRNGQITKPEYIQLVTELARQGLFKNIPRAADNR